MEKIKLTNAKKMRLAAGLTVNDVSKKLGISKQSISYYETGRNTPTVNRLKQLADLYMCEIKDLF